jgi:hypothetical protein
MGKAEVRGSICEAGRSGQERLQERFPRWSAVLCVNQTAEEWSRQTTDVRWRAPWRAHQEAPAGKGATAQAVN